MLAKATWQQWYARLEEALDAALALGRPVFAGGLSMGGSLSLRLAEQRGGDLAGLVLVNPAIFDDKPHGFLAPALRYVMPSVSSIGSDVNKPDVREKTTSRTPVAAYASLRQLWKVTRPELARITVPLRIFTSAEDHVVSPRNSAVIRAGVRSKDVQATGAAAQFPCGDARRRRRDDLLRERRVHEPAVGPGRGAASKRRPEVPMTDRSEQEGNGEPDSSEQDNGKHGTRRAPP